MQNYQYGINKGLNKIMSKMGISTVASYNCSQLFEAVGLHRDVVDLCFKGLPPAFKVRTSTILSKICLICRVKHGQNVNLSNTVVYSNTFTVTNTTPTTQMWLVPYKSGQIRRNYGLP